MKKLLITVCVVALTALTVLLFAGGSNEDVKNETVTARLITDSVGIDDNSFNGAAWRGFLDFYGDTQEEQKYRGDLYDVVAIATQDLFVPNLKQTVENGYDLVISTGFIFANAVAEVAKEYPEQKFMLIDATWINEPNVQKYVFAEEQGSFLVGALAALQAKADGVENPMFGFIGGVPGSVITKFEVGYIQGIKHVLPDAEIVDYYTNDFGSAQLAKIQAKTWYDTGVYAIFSAAGLGGYGTISQAKEYRLEGKNVWAIGVDSDQYEEGVYGDNQSAVLTSMIKKVETAVVMALSDVENEVFEAGTVRLDLTTDSVGYSDRNTEIQAGVIEEVENIKEDILSGDIVIYSTYREARDAGVVPEDLNAKDD